MRTITITGFQRPELFQRLLKSLIRNDLRGWRIYAQIDPSPYVDEFRPLMKLLDGLDWQFTINDKRLGVRLNPYTLLKRVFDAGSSLNIYLEEDLEISPDVTRLAHWYDTHHMPEWMCLNLLAGGCGSSGLLSNPNYPRLLFPAKTFNSLGFVAREQEWVEHFHPHWCVGEQQTVGWDWAMYRHLQREGLYSLQPVLARANHTGREGGEHCDARFHDETFSDLDISTCATIAGGYNAVSRERLPPLVRRHAIVFDDYAAMFHSDQLTHGSDRSETG